MNEEIENVLSDLYHSLNSHVSFSSPLKLYQAAKLKIPGLKLKDVKNWLSKDLIYTLHHPTRRNYTTRRVLVHRMDEQWQADLVDLQNVPLSIYDCTKAGVKRSVSERAHSM